MTSRGPEGSAHLVPLMRYRDVGVASEWLCAAFGFEPHFAAKAPDGSVFYAELRFDHSMVMLGAAGAPALDAVMQPGAANSQVEPQQSCYVIVDDILGHYKQSKRTGAEMVLELKNDDSGGAGYSCRDLEGHVWNFGTYNPWKAQGQQSRRKARPRPASEMPGYRAAIAGTIVISILSGWFVYGYVRGGLDLQRLREALLGPRQSLATGGIGETAGAREAQAEVSRAQRTMQALQAELLREREAKVAAQRAADTARVQADSAKAQADTAKAQADTARAQADTAKAQADKATEQARSEADKSAMNARAEVARATAAAKAESEKAIAALEEKAKRVAPTASTNDRSDGTIANLKSEIARQHDTVGQISADLKSLQTELEDAQAQRDAALKAVSEAKDATEQERSEKDAALKALADAGARIATLEVELKRVKVSLQQANTARAVARMRTTSPSAKKPATEKDWPYSEW